MALEGSSATLYSTYAIISSDIYTGYEVIVSSNQSFKRFLQRNNLASLYACPPGIKNCIVASHLPRLVKIFAEG